MVTFVTGNVKNFPDIPESQVRASARAIADLNFGVWLGQEIQPGEDGPVILNELGKNYGAAHIKTNIPHFYDKRKVKLLGTRRKTVPFSPVLKLTPVPRLLTAAVWELKSRPNLGVFATVNAHLIAGAYNGRPGTQTKAEVAARQRQWDIEFEALHNFIQVIRHDTVLDDGRRPGVVISGADWNHPRPPKPVPNFTWLVGERLDRLGCTTNGRILVDEVEDGTVQLPDHLGQWTRVRLAKA